ncbi:MAG: hypothetical protein ABWK00_01190 [Desulfurococcaceae archaeon]
MSIGERLAERAERAFSQTKFLELAGERLAIKDYAREPGIVKWLVIKTANLAVQVYPFVLSAAARLEREAAALRSIRRGFKTPRPRLIDYGGQLLVREYVEGDDYSRHVLDRGPSELIGRALGELHSSGWALGDTKATNFVISEEGVPYLVDAEQAVEGPRPEQMAWDVLVLASTSVTRVLEADIRLLPRYRPSFEALLASYVDALGDLARDVARASRGLRMRVVAGLLLPYPFSFRAISALSSGGRG